jgi:phosphoribosylglycinamide formyltransferase-1
MGRWIVTLRPDMKRIVILISGRGSNMEAIVKACEAEGWSATIAAVVSNRPTAAGLTFAQEHGIGTAVVDHKAFESREAFDAELTHIIDGYSPDLLVLAGFMRILTPSFTSHYAGRMLNIHPSLLPAFTGLHTHQRALDIGCKFVGATVHFVTAELDHGAIVAQAVAPVLPGDDEASLSARVLKLEHRMYPSAVRWFVEAQLSIENDVVRQTTGESQSFS